MLVVFVVRAASAQEALPPKLVTGAPVVYPDQARKDHVEGDVVVELSIDEAGKVTDARVVTSAGHGLDEAALAAARKYAFAPATMAGKAIASTLDLTIPFRLPPSPKRERTAEIVQTGADQKTVVVAQRPVPVASLHEPEHISASDSEMGHEELLLLPHYRTEDVVEAVPGMFAVQHAGGGKSDQYFMRGFNLDHGTDAAFFVDGAPINAVSHGHGQGYSDLHFLIPETIGAVESTKGPYSVRVGDFATAGSITFHMLDHLTGDGGYAKLEVGPYGHVRGLVLASPNLGDKWRMLAAAEAFNDDGPFVHPDNYNRFKGYLKVSHVLDESSAVSLTAQAYGGSWNMSGVLPARAVCGEGDGTPVPAAYAGARCLSRWDSVDPSQGGSMQRGMLLATYSRRIGSGAGRGDLEATAYAVMSSFQMFPNDGIAAPFQPEGELYGSQVEQDDTRVETGIQARITKHVDVAGFDVLTTAGLQFRYDAIGSALHRTEQRVRLDGMPGIPGPITDSAINESELGAYVEADWHPTRWLRFVLGGRVDRVDVAVSNQSPTALDPVSGYRGDTQFSPKASAIVTPVKPLDLFVNYGRGFHSNDARTLVSGQATTLLATATGAEAGATLRPFKGASVSAIAWILDLTSELTIDGDTASTSPSGPTRRVGGDFIARYEYKKEVFVDAAVTVASARYTDAADIAAHTDYVALAPTFTLSAGAGVRHQFGPVQGFASLQARAMGDHPGIEDYSLVAKGFLLFNAEVGARWRFVELAAQMINIGDVDWREGQFNVQSRLPGEGPNPPVGMSFTPGYPRMVLGHLALYW